MSCQLVIASRLFRHCMPTLMKCINIDRSKAFRPTWRPTFGISPAVVLGRRPI